MLDLTCAHCKTHVMLYQKDGPGPLIRCYLDRIHEPKELINLHEVKDPPQELKCPSCYATLGKIGIYTKENRPVFVLEENSIDSINS